MQYHDPLDHGFRGASLPVIVKFMDFAVAMGTASTQPYLSVRISIRCFRHCHTVSCGHSTDAQSHARGSIIAGTTMNVLYPHVRYRFHYCFFLSCEVCKCLMVSHNYTGKQIDPVPNHALFWYRYSIRMLCSKTTQYSEETRENWLTLSHDYDDNQHILYDPRWFECEEWAASAVLKSKGLALFGVAGHPNCRLISTNDDVQQKLHELEERVIHHDRRGHEAQRLLKKERQHNQERLSD